MKTGIVSVEDVPVPQLKKGFLLVRNETSLISTGTEGGTIKLGKMSLLGKARARPEQVKKVIQALKTEGLLTTINAVKRTLDIPIPLGYSCAGVVEKTSTGAGDIPEGTPVACGGAGMALHADYVVVPRNLVVPIPEGVPFHRAAFTTVGSIALQGVRIADCRLGEHVAVIGLGLVGLLTAQILKAGGCHVLGIDVDQGRVEWAEKNGICSSVSRGDEALYDRILDFSGGYGADSAIITAAVENNDPIVLAGELVRQRGRVVVVGRTVMEAPRETYLFKELQLCTSYAYGPGTGDETYEMEGFDYPIGYVRWTENRNMQCFLDLLKEKKIDIDQLMTHKLPIEKAPHAFDLIENREENTIGIVLEYTGRDEGPPISASRKEMPRIVPGERFPDRLRIGIIGAGSFATNIMVPLLAKRKDVQLQAIASATGLKATALAKKYGISKYTSDAAEILEASDIDCVFIFTRHGTHAAFAEKALLSNKHVFVEKPLALDEDGLEAVVTAREKSGKALMVGFNRRFSPLAEKLKAFFSNRCQPMVMEFRGNVGYRPPEHWLHDPVDGGGVVLGEGCHYIDFCRWMVDSPIVETHASCIGPSNTRAIPEDNAIISLRFEDGSLASILYLSNGARGFQRERCEIHSEGRSAVWRDFKYLKLVKDLAFPRTHRRWIFPGKGYAEELEAFFSAAFGKGPTSLGWLESQIDASRASIDANEFLKNFRIESI